MGEVPHLNCGGCTMKKGNPWALIPFVVFLVLFIGAGVIIGDFYHFPCYCSHRHFKRCGH